MDQQLAHTSGRKLIEEPGHEKDWATPPKFCEVLYQFDSVVLDPCSNEHSVLRSKERWTLDKKYTSNGKVVSKSPDDTFTTPWPLNGLVYCNPPYGKESDPFLKKMVEESKRGVEIIALVPARVDAIRWHKWAEQADIVLFWKGRISFINPATGKPQAGTKFPSAVLYWGSRADRFLQVFGPLGSARVRPA